MFKKFRNIVIFGQKTYIHSVNQHYQKIIFLYQKGQNRRSKFDNQKYIRLIISRFINNYNYCVVDFDLF
mgnify:CR=1 FL=1